MATNISSDAQKVLAGATPEAVNFVTQNAPGDKVTSGEARRLLDQFNINAQNVLSASNVSGAVTNPANQPSLSDPQGLFDFYLQSPEIKAAQTEYQDVFGQLTEARKTAREQNTAIENLPQALNVIRGEQAQAQRLSSDKLAALAESADVVGSKLQALRETGFNRFNIAQQQRGELTNLITSFPGAGISYRDTVESASKKAFDFGQKQAEQERTRSYQDSLRAIALQNGLKTGGSIEKLEKRIGKFSKEALDRAKRDSDLSYKIALAQYDKLSQPVESQTIDVASLFEESNPNVIQTPFGNMAVTGGEDINSYFNYVFGQ